MPSPKDIVELAGKVARDVEENPAAVKMLHDAAADAAGTDAGKALIRMAGGNQTAMRILEELMPKTAADTSSFTSLNPIGVLKSDGLSGARIATLHADVAGGDMSTLHGILEARQRGLLSQTDLRGAIDHTGPALDVSGIMDRVKGARQIEDQAGHRMAKELDRDPHAAIMLATSDAAAFGRINAAHERVEARLTSLSTIPTLTPEACEAAAKQTGGTAGRILGDTNHSPGYNMARLFAEPRPQTYRDRMAYYGG